jgi:rhomboid family GlyGly-CTERM serine protease
VRLSRRIPWVTALVAILALAAWARPAWAAAWVYDREAILGGEIWRLWTGHLVHFSRSHLGWNLLAVALVGAWIEWSQFRGGRLLWLFAPPAISLVLLACERNLAFYGGLSGMATAAVTFACLSERRIEGRRSLWTVPLLLLAAKIGWEFVAGHSLFANFSGMDLRVVPLSHLAGMAVAAAISQLFSRDPQGQAWLRRNP